jgi:hypothetical protein
MSNRSAAMHEHEEPGHRLLTVLEQQYGITPATLQRIAALVVMWATFESDFEKVLWQLSGENPFGKIPTTDKMQITQRITRFRELSGTLDGQQWQEIIELICDVAADLAAYRNAVVHGHLLPAIVGGGLVLNARWYGERRARPGMIAHIDERLVGIMLDALHQLLIVMSEIARCGSSPNTNPRILARRQQLMRARSSTQEVRYLTALMNSEKY